MTWPSTASYARSAMSAVDRISSRSAIRSLRFLASTVCQLLVPQTKVRGARSRDLRISSELCATKVRNSPRSMRSSRAARISANVAARHRRLPGVQSCCARRQWVIALFANLGGGQECEAHLATRIAPLQSEKRPDRVDHVRRIQIYRAGLAAVLDLRRLQDLIELASLVQNLREILGDLQMKKIIPLQVDPRGGRLVQLIDIAAKRSNRLARDIDFWNYPRLI